MAICWSFALVLLLTLTALVAPTQPLFQPPPASPHRMHARIVNYSKAAIQQPTPLPGVERSLNALVGRYRRLFQEGDKQTVCDAQLKCERRNSTTTTSERSQTRAILDNYRLPPKLPTHFQSDRMVPSGPNPLHNSNRSQVIFP